MKILAAALILFAPVLLVSAVKASLMASPSNRH